MFDHNVSLLMVSVLLAGCVGPSVDSTTVRPGIEVLASDSAHLVRDQRVGLLTNHTGIGRDGTHDIELLLGAGVNLTALFSPEHGFRGILDQPNVDHDVDSATGLPIFSLYGETRAPTSEMLDLIDVLIVDLQDIGARPYTYISTTLLAMQAAEPAGVHVIVVDRPNPIGGIGIDGPVLDPPHASFVGMLPLPQRHGLTIGELARFGAAHLEIGGELSVVPAAGWERDMWFDDTALPWVRPSPNMPDLESATHYPGLVWFEATNLSVGRGTPIAFQVVGAPWLDPAAVIAALPPDETVTITDTLITPIDPPDRKYGGQEIPAVRLLVADRNVYRSSDTAARLLAAIQQVHPDQFEVRERSLLQRAGVPALFEVATGVQPVEPVIAQWSLGLASFRDSRAPFLLYPDP